MPIRNKINILSQEVFRRLHNTSSDIEWDKKVVMLEKFMNELKASGYSKKDRAEILQSGVRRFENLKQKEEKGIRPLYRKRSFDEDERKKRKEEKRCNWFKQTNHEFSTVFFVPPTPDSLLLKNLRKTEQQFKIGEKSRVKFVELSGVKYKEYYRSIDPLSKNCLPNEGCFVCKDMQHDQRDTAPLQYSLGKASTFSENQTHEKSSIAILLSKENRRSTAPPFVKPSFCKTSSVGYSIICKLCKQRNKQVSYEGETARNAYIRGKEHKREYEKKSKNSVLNKHVLSQHENEKDIVDFEMKVVKKFRNPLNRQIEESIRIRNKPQDQIMNSKSEFHGPCIKRKILEK